MNLKKITTVIALIAMLATSAFAELKYFKGENGKYKRLQTTQSRIRATVTIGSLMWQDEPYTKQEKKAYDNNTNHGKAGNWEYATGYCSDLVLNGYSDWRLPNKDTLQALYANRSQLTHMVTSGYWSSSSYAGDDGKAWVVNINGGDYWNGKSNGYYVRCVRDSDDAYKAYKAKGDAERAKRNAENEKYRDISRKNACKNLYVGKVVKFRGGIFGMEWKAIIIGIGDTMMTIKSTDDGYIQEVPCDGVY